MAENEREIVLNMLLLLKPERQGHIILRETLDSYAYLSKPERAFITRLYEGVIEKKIYLDFVIDKFSKLPVKKMKPVVMAVLELTVYQLFFMNKVPESAAINEGVKLVKRKGLTGLSGFVNGVLRNITRNRNKIEIPDKDKDLTRFLEVRYSMPLPLVKYFINEYGKDKAEKILKAFEKERAVTIRVNMAKSECEKLIRELEADGIRTEKGNILERAFKISGFDNLNFISAFENGEFNVQDESSQLAAELAGVKEGDIVLDLCSAPGGKTAVMAEKAGVSGKVIACDISENKLGLIEDTIKRLGFKNVKTKINDASVFNEDFKEKADVVMCDLPCSGLGVIGRKKDIKYNFSPEKIKALAELQKKILTNAKEYVKEGGILMFSTCTLTKLENEENFKFISDFEGFEPVDFSKELPESLKNGEYGKRIVKEAEKGYIKLIPGEFDTDGFFISKAIRKSKI